MLKEVCPGWDVLLVTANSSPEPLPFEVTGTITGEVPTSRPSLYLAIAIVLPFLLKLTLYPD